MAIPSYVFGGDTGLTPQDLKQRRELISAMAARNASRQPQDIWDGLSMLGQGLANRWGANRLAEQEKKGLAGAQSKFDALFSGAGAGGGGNEATITPVSYSPDEQKGMPENPMGKWLMGQLKSDPDLKLTPAAAAGFTGNMDTETGGFNHMQEIKPTVPGSRGGFGFAQWTGDRRNQYEAWAKQQGMDPTSKEANFGFLKHELLNTPEGKVLASLQGVDDPATAAAIVSSQYLRPGTPNIQNRVSAAQHYAGMGPTAAGAATVQPAGGVRLAQAGGPDLNSLISAYSDPWMTGDQRDVLKLYIQQQLQAADPETKLKLKKMGLEIDALEHPKPEYGFTEVNGNLVRTDKTRGTAEPIYNGGQKNTDDIAEYNFYVQQSKAAGEAPLPFNDWMKGMKRAAATNIDLGDNSFDKEFGKGLASVYIGQIEQGNNAIATKAGMQQIRQLMAGKGGALDGFASIVAPYLPENFLPENANDITAAQAIISGLIPKQRVAGSGSTSDFDAKMFARGLPSVWNKPGANELITDTMEAYADYQIAVSDIIQNIGADPTVKSKPAAIREALKQLPDPFARWKEYIKDNPATAKGDQPKPSKPSEPDADGWITFPDGTQIREKK